MPYLISPETRINTYVLSRQSAPETVALVGGGYVTAWSGAGPTDSGYSVYLQRFDAAGARVGEEVLVNTTSIYSQQNPTIAALPSGGYAVVWDSIVPGGAPATPPRSAFLCGRLTPPAFLWAPTFRSAATATPSRYPPAWRGLCRFVDARGGLPVFGRFGAALQCGWTT